MLNNRQWDLYKFIEFATTDEDGIGPVSVEQICHAFPQHYKYKPSEHNYSNCPLIYQDIDALNASDEVGFIIIKKNNQFFIGDEDETYDYLRKLWWKLDKAASKYHVVSKKYQQHSQGRLLSRHLDPIDENSKAKPFMESYKNDK